MDAWIVEFACPRGSEAVIREGTRDEVAYPDGLGCAPTAVHRADECRVLGAWAKGDDIRVEAVTADGRRIG